MKQTPWLTVALRAAILMAFALPLAWWALWSWGAERHWVLGALQYAPFWGWLLPSAFVLLLSWTQPWKWRLVALSGTLIVLGPLMGLEWPRGESGTGHLRVMTYNIKAFQSSERPEGLGPVIWEIAQHDPDVIVMQDAGQAEAGALKLTAETKQLIGPREHFTFGQYIVASKHPLKDCAKGFMNYFGETHTYARCVVSVHGKDIDLYSVHLLSPRKGLNALRYRTYWGRHEWQRSMQARLIQSEKLVSDFLARGRPAIIAGDFNAPQRSRVIENFEAVGLRDAFEVAGAGYGYTHGHSLKPGMSINRIDHILVTPDLAVAAAEVGGHEGSEHRPVIADLYVHRD